MIFSIPQLRAYVLSCFNQSSVAGNLAPADLDYALNEAYMSRCMDLIMASEGYFEETHAITLVAEQAAYALPSNYVADQKEFVKVARVERLIGGYWLPLAFKKRLNEAVSSTGVDSADGYVPTYEFRGRSIVFDPPPASAESGTTRLVYAYQPPRLRSATAQAGASATITLDTDADPRNDYYNGSKIMITSGVGAGQIRDISDYVGSTKVATVSVAWTTNPTSASVFSTLINTDFPEIFHELIALDACLSGYLREREASLQVTTFAQERRDKLDLKFKAIIENRTNYPKYTVPWNIELGG